MKIAVPLAKYVLAPLGITAAASALNAGIQKKNKTKEKHGSGTETLIISKEKKKNKKKTWIWDRNFNNF